MLNDQVIADNHALIERNRELECELARLKAKLGRVLEIASDLHSQALALSDLFGDGIVPENATREMAFKRSIAVELLDAIK